MTANFIMKVLWSGISPLVAEKADTIPRGVIWLAKSDDTNI